MPQIGKMKFGSYTGEVASLVHSPLEKVSKKKYFTLYLPVILIGVPSGKGLFNESVILTFTS